jgi:(p)ppGpp synthase/HD superfamily hydrolase
VNDGSATVDQKPPPDWIADSPVLSRSYGLAAEAHASQTRATDGAPFLDHALEVSMLLHEDGLDEELQAVGLLHDSVERGSLSEERLRAEMGEGVADLVMALTEDGSIESFEQRKEALRTQVKAAGDQAITVFAADKLSDIRGLRRGIDRYGSHIEGRMGTTVDGMADHYLESVEMISRTALDPPFVPELREQLELLEGAIPSEGIQASA